MNRMLFISCIGFVLIACSHDESDKIEEAGFSMITGYPVGASATCESFENVKVIDRINKTAGALNHPAYVIGYNYDCMSSLLGRHNETLYIGFVNNVNTGNYECIHHHGKKDVVVSNNWYMCGGLN